MKQTTLVDGGIVESGFAERVIEMSGVDINRCYQCLTCTLSCPLSFTMDYLPHQLLRMIQFGAETEVLRSSTIWLCASCETCATRCPNEIDIPGLMDALRQLAIRESVSGKEPAVRTFHQIFMKGIRQRGRLYELGMLIELKLRLNDLFSDLGLGLRMLLKNKLSIVPKRLKRHKEIAEIFRKSGEGLA